MEDNKSESKQLKIDFKSISQELYKHKYLFVKVLGTTFVIACILTLSLHNYYVANVTLAPERSVRTSNGALSSIASSFGVSLGGASSNGDALSPTLYPDMMNSVDFKTSLFPIKIQKLNSDEAYTYYDYLKNHQKIPWWSELKRAVFSIFASKKEEEPEAEVNPFMLTKQQDAIIKMMNSKISCEVNNKTNVISISVTDQDPLVAAIIADSVKQRLQDVITTYRTSKARVDLEFNKKLYKETKAKYDDARHNYAAYADANLDVILQRDRNKQIELENEMQLRYQAFSTVAAQLQAAEAKVQEETPAFTTLQSVTVPVKKAGPVRSRLVILYCFIVGIITCLYLLYKGGQLILIIKWLLGYSDKS